MRVKLYLITGLGLFSSAIPSYAHDLTLTIYGAGANNRAYSQVQNTGQALVQDNRDIKFERGEQTLAFPNISSMINPSTVSILAEDITVLEQNFDFDLITPNKLMEKSLGQTITIVRTNPGTGRSETKKAKVLSVNDGVVIELDGKVEVLRDDDIPTRVIFDELPKNLRAEPVLSIKIDSKTPSTRPTHFSYLTSGLSWKADYLVAFNEEDESLDIQGWATLTNTTETDFLNANVSVVAGQVRNFGNHQRNPYNYSRTGTYNIYSQYHNMQGQQQNFRISGNESSPHEVIGNSYIYPLSDNIDILSKQTKQIRIIEALRVPAKRIYEYRTYGFHVPKTPVSPDVRIAFSNSKKSGLQEALPQGTVRVFEKDSKDRSQFIGEDLIGHIPAGSTLALKTGDAFDVKVKGRVVSDTGRASLERKVQMEYVFTNAKTEPVTVALRQVFPGDGSHKIVSESDNSRLDDAYTRIWDVTVEAESEYVLDFEVQTNR